MLFVISGPSGVGKDTIAQRVLKSLPALRLSVSWTTRDPRPGEVQDYSYHFATRDEFMAKVAEDGFLEWAEYVGNLYGTPLPPQTEDWVLVIEVQGAMQVKDRRPGAVMIFIKPPTLDVLKDRLVGRDGENSVHQNRLRTALDELALADKYDYQVVNDDLDRAVDEITDIMVKALKA